MKRPVSSGSTTRRLTRRFARRLRPCRRCSVVLTSASSASASTHTRLECGWPSGPIVVRTPHTGRPKRSRWDRGDADGDRRGGGAHVPSPQPVASTATTCVGRIRHSTGTSLVGVLGRDRVAEVADRPAGVLRRQRVQVLEGARLGHLHDGAADLEVAERLPGVVAEQGHARVPAHVPLLREAAHGVHPDEAVLRVAPHHRGLRGAVGGDGRQRRDRRALDEVAVGRRDLRPARAPSSSPIVATAATPSGSRARPRRGASARASRPARR